jgi:serine/threonine protein phosphatase PrpC
MSVSDEDTVEIVPTVWNAEDVVAESFDEPGLEIAALTHTGLVRNANEDQFSVVRRTRDAVVLASSIADIQASVGQQHSWLLAVADGVGGHVSGEVASATALSTILNVANELSSWVMRPAEEVSEDFEARVDVFSRAIQQELQSQAESNRALAGMATTVTTLYIFGSSAVVVNVGDSRCYLVRSDEIHQITCDHTLGRDLEEKGLSADVVQSYRNVLTRCFNTAGDAVKMDVFQFGLQADDQLLLCTDGLTDMVEDQVILQLVTADTSTKNASERLVRMALNNGGRDNVTVVLARVQ